MLISLGKINFKKYLFIFVPIIKLIMEISGLKKRFYGVPNILIQYLFLCIAKFFNVIFWFILEKNIKFKRTIHSENYIKTESVDIIKENKENKKEEIKKTYSKTSSQEFSQKEIDLFEIEKMKKKKFYKEIAFLIIISLIDIISNISYLVSYASISYEKEKRDNNRIELKDSNSYILEEILINYFSSNSTNNSTDNNNIKYNDEKNDNIINIIPFRISIRIIIFFLLSLIFFYYDRPHRHQFISLLIIIITILFADFLEILLNIQKNSDDILIHLFITLIQEFFFCLYNILGSKYLSISHSNVYKLLFFNGLFGILMMIVIHFTTGNIHCNDLHIHHKFCKKDDGSIKNFYNFSLFDRRLTRLIPSLLLTVIEMACTWLLIFNQTANHLAIAYSIHLTFRFLIGRNKLENNHIIIGSLSFIIISFFALIYNEILVLRFCNLDKNTSEEIEQRAIEDRLLVERISVENSYEIN